MEETLRPCTASAYSAIVDILTKDHMRKVKSRVSSFPKGKGSVPIRLNEINWDLLSDQYLVEAEYYSNNLGKYLKAMIEEHCEKRYLEREKIYYKDHFDIIEAAIKAQMQLKIVLQDRETKHIKPYRIVTDPLAMYHYLIGLDMDSSKAGNLTEPKAFSYRIARMGKVSSLSSLNGSIKEADRERLDKTISENGVQFMSDEEEEFKISLTPEGKEKYDRMLHLRPQYSGEPKKDKSGCYTYTFRCTARQIEYYFFKFGEDAYIRSPENMRQKFLSMYHAAVKKYS